MADPVMRAPRRHFSRALMGTAVAVAATFAAVHPVHALKPTGCQPSPSTSCVESGTPVGLTDSSGNPVPAAAGVYGWGVATEADGSVLVGDYWNYRILHYNADGTPATPFVFVGNLGFQEGSNEAPFGICVDNNPASAHFGWVYMTEGSLYDVNVYNASGAFQFSWGLVNATYKVKFTYPSQCAVNPVTNDVYVSNQWGKSVFILDPGNPTNLNGCPASGCTPPSPNTILQPRGLGFDPNGSLYVADEGHKRIDYFADSSAAGLSAAPAQTITIKNSNSASTTFDMRGLALDTANHLLFVTNGQNCLVQEFNEFSAAVNPGKFVLNFNETGTTPTSNCGTFGQLAPAGEFEDGARGLAVTTNPTTGAPEVWAGDLADFRVQVFNEAGQVQWVDDPNLDTSGDATAAAAQLPPTGGFNGPRDAAFDPAGNMYVTDMFNERLEEFTPNPDGGFTFAQAWGMRGDVASTFNYPRLLCWDPLTPNAEGGRGGLVVANTDSNEVTIWDPASSPPALLAVAQGLADPYGVACDTTTGEIYVANSNAKNIVVLDGVNLVTATPTDTMTQLGTMGTGVLAGFTRGIAVDSDGSVWTDLGTQGTVYHFASWSSGGALVGQFSTTAIARGNPFGIALDANYIYIAMSTPNVVAQYTRDGTLQGTFGGSYSQGGKTSVNLSKFQTPQGLTFDSHGTLWVADMNDNRLVPWTVP